MRRVTFVRTCDFMVYIFSNREGIGFVVLQIASKSNEFSRSILITGS